MGNSGGQDWKFQARLKFSSEIENFKRSWIFSRFGPLGARTPFCAILWRSPMHDPAGVLRVASCLLFKTRALVKPLWQLAICAKAFWGPKSPETTQTPDFPANPALPRNPPLNSIQAPYYNSLNSPRFFRTSLTSPQIPLNPLKIPGNQRRRGIHSIGQSSLPPTEENIDQLNTNIVINQRGKLLCLFAFQPGLLHEHLGPFRQHFSNMPAVKWPVGFAKVPYQGRPLAPPQAPENAQN